MELAVNAQVRIVAADLEVKSDARRSIAIRSRSSVFIRHGSLVALNIMARIVTFPR
jgi:hypothetical protein